MKKALAIDVGGTKIYSAIIDETGTIISPVRKDKTPKTFQEIKDTFKDIIKQNEENIDVVAFCTCGAVNNSNTKILGSTGNIVSEYSTIDFASLSLKPVFVENDANCAAWAEHEVGMSKGVTNSVMLTLGTGVGGGIIVNDILLKGQNGAAGEMHFKMYCDKRRKCTCGSWDCFEIYASGKGLKLTAEEITKNKDVTTYDVVDGVKNNDKVMLSVLNKWQNDITDGIIGLVNIFDCEMIVLSGSMAEFVDTDYIEKNVNSQIVTTPTKVRKATAGNHAGMIGAGLLALEALNKGKFNGKI